jgi:hypothetical protein
MNGPTQLGINSLADLVLQAKSVGTTRSRRQAKCSVTGQPRWSKAKKSLIATVPRLEIAVTPSIQKRKIFLIATKSGVCVAPGIHVQAAETTKINRQPERIEPSVSHGKQRTVSQINRHKNPSSSYSSELPSYTQHRAPCHSSRPDERRGDHKKQKRKRRSWDIFNFFQGGSHGA